MFQYLLKRILYFLPTLLLISVVVFFLSKCAGERLECEQDLTYDPARCIEEATLKGYNKPIFYFTLTTSAHPDTLHRILREERRITQEKLIGQYGNWEAIQSYYHQIGAIDQAITKASFKEKTYALIEAGKTIDLLYTSYKEAPIVAQLEQLNTYAKDSSMVAVLPLIRTLQQRYQIIKEQSSPYLLFIPKLKWYGLDNQYHYWVSNFLSGDWGHSAIDKRQVMDKIAARLPWTLAITLPAILLAYLLSIPIGVYTAVYKDSKFDKGLSSFLLFLFSMPLFWVGSLAVLFFTTPEYGMKWFPSIWLEALDIEQSILQQIWQNADRLLLPIICMTYGSLAFISRQLRSSMVETLQQEFIKTARAKGLSEQQVIWKHAFRNALFPLITIFANVLPRAFGGSVIIETIFNIQGMGRLLFDAITASDWQVVYIIIMIATVLTVVGILLADILYAWADPRVRFQ